MDLARFLAVAGEPLRDVSSSSQRLASGRRSAICAIRAQVESSRTPDVTRLDGFLLETASSHIDPEVRVRLIKFYAMFKIVEMLRYERFRGFPA